MNEGRARENPFERFGIDPREGPRGITERMRELLEDATSDAEREKLRAVWEELTVHPAARLRAALHAHPDPEPRYDDAPPPPPRAERLASLTLYDLALTPDLTSVLEQKPRET